MSDIETNVVDNYKEHNFHQSFHSDCSDCFAERKLARETRVSAIKELGTSPAEYRVDFSIWSNNPLG